MYIDSHCHLNFPELAENLESYLDAMRTNNVTHALCVSVEISSFHDILGLVEKRENLFASVGVHPDYELEKEPSVEELVELGRHSKVIAIGETGLDYYRLKGDLEWQRERFRIHIRAALEAGKPLIIHTREAIADTLKILREEDAQKVGGVMHCFTENLDAAQEAIELGFYISFSGIVTFKNATQVKEAASKIPLDKILIETDAPYLAPVPHRGKLNHPALVVHVADEIGKLRGISSTEVGMATSQNFHRLFKL